MVTSTGFRLGCLRAVKRGDEQLHNFSYGNTAYALGDSVVFLGTAPTSPTLGPSIGVQAMPNITSTMNMISVHGEYKFDPGMSLLFGYSFERFNYKDPMYTSGNTQYGDLLIPGVLVPNESVHTAGAALRIRF